MAGKIRRLRVITNAKLPEIKPSQSLQYEGRDWTFLGVLNPASKSKSEKRKNPLSQT